MAIEPQVSVAPDDASSAIENELPAYRAISPLAILSLLLGLVAILAFASIWFAISGVLAIILGLLADRKIDRMSDVLTGRGLAKAGIGLGLIFSLSAVTIHFVQDSLLHRGAKAFGESYAKTLAEGKIADAMYYRIPPEARKGQTPKSSLDEFMKNAREPQMAESYLGDTRRLQERLAREGQELHFEAVESAGYQGVERFAILLLEVHGPAYDTKPGVEYAMVELSARPIDGPNGWWVKNFVYPYTPRSHQLESKPLDDGHNH